MGFTPCLWADSKNSTAPKRLPWSVSPTAGMPSSRARWKSGSILIAPSRSEYWLCRWRWTKGRGLTRLLPFDRRRRLRRDVVDHPVDALHLVDDPVREDRQHLGGHAGPVGRHRVLGSDAAHRDGVLVGALVAHHAHGLHREQ